MNNVLTIRYYSSKKFNCLMIFFYYFMGYFFVHLLLHSAHIIDFDNSVIYYNYALYI